MKRFYMINYLLCGICLLWMTGCSNMLDEMRPKDKIPQDALSESDLTKCLTGYMLKWKNWFSSSIWTVM